MCAWRPAPLLGLFVECHGGVKCTTMDTVLFYEKTAVWTFEFFCVALAPAAAAYGLGLTLVCVSVSLFVSLMAAWRASVGREQYCLAHIAGARVAMPNAMQMPARVCIVSVQQSYIISLQLGPDLKLCPLTAPGEYAQQSKVKGRRKGINIRCHKTSRPSLTFAIRLDRHNSLCLNVHQPCFS